MPEQATLFDMPVARGPIESAVHNKDFPAARREMAVKLARMMDQTDSARDVKSVALTLTGLLDSCEADSKRDAASDETPLAKVLRMASGE